jgi:leucyl aminopeptidase
MEFSVKSGSPEKQRSACIVVGVFEPRRLSPIAEQLDKISDGYISALLRRGELEGKPGQTLLLHHVPNVLSERILLIGCGKERELDERQYKQVIQKTINTLNDTGSMEAVCFLTELHVKGRNNYWKVRQAVETAKETLYKYAGRRELDFRRDLHVVRLDLAAGTLAGRIGNGEPVRLSVSLDEGFILVYIL